MNLNRLHMLERENVQLMFDLDILDPRADEFSAYTLWGLVIHDPVVWMCKLALPRDPKFPSVIPARATHTVVAGMTAKEKEALRDRVLARCEKLKGEMHAA